jgi:hypothetical protein
MDYKSAKRREEKVVADFNQRLKIYNYVLEAPVREALIRSRYLQKTQTQYHGAKH